jgi:hypothetical protein
VFASSIVREALGDSRIIVQMRWLLVAIAVLGVPAHGTAPASASAGVPTARQIVTKLRASGLPVGKLKVYDAVSDANHLLGRPHRYASKASFHDRRINDGSAGFAVSSGGSVEVFASRADAKQRFDFIVAVTRSPALFAEYDYLESTVVLRLSSRLTRGQATRYATAVRRLV